MAKGFWKSQSVPPSSGQKRQTRRERFERQWRKISWIIFNKEDVEKLERGLHGHILALQLYEAFLQQWECSTQFEPQLILHSMTLCKVEADVSELTLLTRKTELQTIAIYDML
jgi:hypothetical protein